jgi:hypothetical protein
MVSFLFVCDIAAHSVSTSPGDCVFVDSEGLNARETSTAQTPHRNRFRRHIVERDGPACVVTKVSEDGCDAAHLIPHSKGDAVRSLVSSYNYLMTFLSSTLQE